MNLTLDDIKKAIDELYPVYKNRGREVVIYTGLEGSYMFDWALAHQAGSIPDTAGRFHAKLVYRIPNKHRAIDINNEVWGWEIAQGKIWWTNLHSLQRVPEKLNPKLSRFNQWEKTLNY